jgi:hypothetical protein
MTIPIAEVLTMLETAKLQAARDPTRALQAMDDITSALYRRLSADLGVLSTGAISFDARDDMVYNP